MRKGNGSNRRLFSPAASLAMIVMVIVALLCPFNIFCQNTRPIKPVKRQHKVEVPDSIPLGQPAIQPSEVVVDSVYATATSDSLILLPVDSIKIVDSPQMALLPDSIKETVGISRNVREFNPDPMRAVWMSALFPGLGQVYNRRYWKLPLVAAGFMGLGYGASWNNSMLKDYTRAYGDIMDNDPNTKSYMDFFPATVKEEDLDKTWLTNILKSRKDFYRRNRDLCIISMVGVYLLAIVDAYVDASLAHFDISPDLSMEVAPAVILDTRTRPGLGLQWALRF